MVPEKRTPDVLPAPARGAPLAETSETAARRRTQSGETRLAARGRTVITPKGFPLYL